MANKSLHTNQVTFMDLTDDRKLEVYITSTLPITQIKDSNTGEYTPDWSATTLELSADIYLDSIDVTNNQNTTIVWYEQIGAGIKTQVPNSAYVNGRPASIIINTNKMIDDTMVTYSCEATYQNTTAYDKLTFTRVDTGRNGTNGAPAPTVQAQYSVDGLSGWTAVLNAATHKYIRFSYDAGKTWTVAIKIVGENGTSVSIKGTATARYTVDGTSYYTLSYNSATITDALLGDSYLYGGDLYVCVDSREGPDYFMYVGKIQGPQGNDGKSSYVYIMYATDASGTGMTKNPSSTTTHIGVCVSTATSAPNTASSYTWSKFVGENAKSIILNGSSQIFKVTNSSPVAYLPTSITITAQTINITVAKWEYSVNGGVNWTTITESNNTSGIVLNSASNTISIAGADMVSNSIIIRASNGAYSDTYAIYKVFDGKGIVSIAEQYYQSTSAATQSDGSWSNTVPTWIDGRYIWTRSIITYTDATTSTTSPVCVTGQTGGTGGTGVGVSSIDVWYYQSNYATSLSGGSWSTTAPAWSDGKYVWTKTITTYTNSTTDETEAVCITGQKGSTGKGIKSVTEYYLATSSSSGVTTSTTGWTTTIQTIAADKKYLWNYEVLTYTDNTTSTTTPIIIGAFGDTGSTGKGIRSVTEYYLATASSSGVTTSTTGWTPTIQTLTASKKYLWNYEVITYTDNTTTTVAPVIIGVYGDQGVAAVAFHVYSPNGYLLTNDTESLTLQTFSYEGSTAITSGATYQWAQYIDNAWENINGATTPSLTVTKAGVIKSKSYKCTMVYKSNQYTDTVTVQDKTDIYDSLIQVVSKYSSTNRLYWVLYSTVYTEEGEKDKLLGPVSTTAPTSPASGTYWYKIDETNYTVTLMKYSGTTWSETTDRQELVYDWFLFDDVDHATPLGLQNKVKIITSNDFNKVCSVQCNVFDSESTPITYGNQILTDTSDPIVSSAEPTNPAHGQLWIKTGENGLYTLLAWDSSLEQWIVSETDSRVKVHVSKPTSYEVGDVWVVGSDYEPTVYINGVAQTTKYLAGTMLKAQYSSQSYKDSDWVEALNYKKDIDSLKDNLNTYNQFFSFDEDGLTMQAKNKSGVISEFKTKLTNTELGFYQGDNKVAHINNNQLNISKAEITNGMTISGTAPVLEIGNFILIQESNGSLSIGLKG